MELPQRHRAFRVKFEQIINYVTKGNLTRNFIFRENQPTYKNYAGIEL